MTKAKTKAARRRNRKTIQLAGGVSRRVRPGQGARTDIAPDDAQSVALTARLVHMGLPDTPENRALVRWQAAGCAVGQRLIADSAIKPGTRTLLWEAATHMRRVWLAYDRVIGAPSRHATCLRIMTGAETLAADASSPPLDMRSDEDKHRQAVAAYMRVHGWLMAGPRAEQSATIVAVIDEPDVPISNWPAVRAGLARVAMGMRA